MGSLRSRCFKKKKKNQICFISFLLLVLFCFFKIFYYYGIKLLIEGKVLIKIYLGKNKTKYTN